LLLWTFNSRDSPRSPQRTVRGWWCWFPLFSRAALPSCVLCENQQEEILPEKKFFTMRVVKPWPRLPREAVAAPSLAGFEARLDGALSTMGWWKMSMLMAGGWDQMIFEDPSNPNCSMKNRPGFAGRGSWSSLSRAQACWRGYKQRRAYLERLRYLRANADAAIKVWKTLPSSFALGIDSGLAPAGSLLGRGGIQQLDQGTAGQRVRGWGRTSCRNPQGFPPFSIHFAQASPSVIQPLEHLSQIQASVRMWQARRKYRERLRYFRQNVSGGMGSKPAPGSAWGWRGMVPSVRSDLCPRILAVQLEGEVGASLHGERWRGKCAWWVWKPNYQAL